MDTIQTYHIYHFAQIGNVKGTSNVPLMETATIMCSQLICADCAYV